MPAVKLSKSAQLVDIITDTELKPLEVNVVLALSSASGELQIIDLIAAVRKTNPVSYRFVTDRRFYIAVRKLAQKKYVVYG